MSENADSIAIKEKRGRIFDIDKIELHEREAGRFAHGLNFYKLFWIFFIGSFLGVVVEAFWCIVTLHRYESRVGLIYGPFNLVYGLGALAIAVGLYRLRKKNDIYIFLGGVIIGSAVEYICSLVQELMFGSVSWDYSQLPFNLYGRITLLYSLFWGLLAIIWTRLIYPMICALIMNIPNRIGKALTFILLAFMIFNTVMSALAVNRWNMRINGRGDEISAVWEYFDAHYPDERMSRIYANMRFRQ